MTNKSSGFIHTILFDLDGTLVDTAPDLAHALNEVLKSEGRPALPLETIRPAASHGGRALIRLGFGLEPGSDESERLFNQFLDIYEKNLTRESRPFQGILEVLDGIEQRGMNWGIVTNKTERFTLPLMEQLGLRNRAACIVCGDTTNNNKPHPEPMEYACRMAGSEASQCVYVGDAERDVQAGNHVGMKTLVALYGYIGEQDDPRSWGANDYIRSPGELTGWLDHQER